MSSRRLSGPRELKRQLSHEMFYSHIDQRDNSKLGAVSRKHPNSKKQPASNYTIKEEDTSEDQPPSTAGRLSHPNLSEEAARLPNLDESDKRSKAEETTQYPRLPDGVDGLNPKHGISGGHPLGVSEDTSGEAVGHGRVSTATTSFGNYSAWCHENYCGSCIRCAFQHKMTVSGCPPSLTGPFHL